MVYIYPPENDPPVLNIFVLGVIMLFITMFCVLFVRLGIVSWGQKRK
jgi:hypothetical protein